MKTLCATLAALVLGSATTTAKTIEISVEAIRSNKGLVLVMATCAGQEKPIYGMAAAKEGSVIVTLTGIRADTAQLSLFHDEDGDYKMKMGDRGPREGYARQQVVLSGETNSASLKVHYPELEKEQSK